MTALRLDVVPALDFAQHVYDELSSEQLSAEFDRVFGSAYSVSVFTGWGTPRTNQLWLKRRVDAGTPDVGWLDAVPAAGPRHPIPGLDPVNCTEQLGVPGPWHERLPHFRLAYLASSGEELQSEFLLPRQHAADAIAALDTIGDRIAAVLQISEMRTIAADDLWLSPSYQRETVGLHFTWLRDPDAVAPVVTALEERLAPYAARPHWGKVFSMEPAVVQGLYERFDDFRSLMQELDPKGKFANAWVDHHLGSE
jgi:xylitol oxidase